MLMLTVAVWPRRVGWRALGPPAAVVLQALDPAELSSQQIAAIGGILAVPDRVSV